MKLFCRFNKLFLLIYFLSFFQFSCAQEKEKQSIKFVNFLEKINRYYVDSVDNELLVESAIKEVLNKLDPHSSYIHAKNVKKNNERLKGSFEGIGISFNIFQDTLVVVSPISGGPSEKVGIKAGDRIVKVDGENFAGIDLNYNFISSKLRGKKGSYVDLQIKRSSNFIDFTLQRDKIPILSLDASYMINNEIGYIKVNRFASTTMQEYKDALKKLEKKGIKHLILDLQNNGGGYLKTAVSLADEFLKKEKMIVYTRGINNKNKDYFSTKKGFFVEKKYRIAVLINENSASASEIVSGAIQDWDRGIIIGRRSFGKGLVQRQINLIDGSVVRLTIARYYTPTGRLIQKEYLKKGTDNYKKEIKERIEHGELKNEDSIHFDEFLKFFTLENKRIVYGGGGIMPDIFIPINNVGVTNYYSNFFRKGIIYDFMVKFFDTERSKIEKHFKNFDDFKENFFIDDKILNLMISFGEENGIPKNEKEFLISEETFKIQIKALIAKNLFGENEFYQIINELNMPYQKAIKVLSDKKIYNKELKKI